MTVQTAGVVDASVIGSGPVEVGLTVSVGLFRNCGAGLTKVMVWTTWLTVKVRSWLAGL